MGGAGVGVSRKREASWDGGGGLGSKGRGMTLEIHWTQAPPEKISDVYFEKIIKNR